MSTPKWLLDLALPDNVVKILLDNDDTLSSTTDAELEKNGIGLGFRKKLLLKVGSGSPTSSSSAPGADSVDPTTAAAVACAGTDAAPAALCFKRCPQLPLLDALGVMMRRHRDAEISSRSSPTRTISSL
jgi:hypothetical protein